MDNASSGVQVVPEARCALCKSRDKTSVLIFQGELSDYYYCVRCNRWYEVFLKTALASVVTDKRRIKALQYYFATTMVCMNYKLPSRSALKSLYRKMQDKYYNAYRRLSA